jgi:hypothetical protein
MPTPNEFTVDASLKFPQRDYGQVVGLLQISVRDRYGFHAADPAISPA